MFGQIERQIVRTDSRGLMVEPMGHVQVTRRGQRGSPKADPEGEPWRWLMWKGHPQKPTVPHAADRPAKPRAQVWGRGSVRKWGERANTRGAGVLLTKGWRGWTDGPRGWGSAHDSCLARDPSACQAHWLFLSSTFSSPIFKNEGTLYLQ